MGHFECGVLSKGSSHSANASSLDSHLLNAKSLEFSSNEIQKKKEKRKPDLAFMKCEVSYLASLKCEVTVLRPQTAECDLISKLRPQNSGMMPGIPEMARACY